MDNGNDPPARIPVLEISDEKLIPTNSSLTKPHWLVMGVCSLLFALAGDDGAAG